MNSFREMGSIGCTPRHLGETARHIHRMAILSFDSLACQKRLIRRGFVGEAIDGGHNGVPSALLHAEPQPTVMRFPIDLKPHSEKAIRGVVPVAGCVSKRNAAAERPAASDLEHMPAAIVNIPEIAS